MIKPCICPVFVVVSDYPNLQHCYYCGGLPRKETREEVLEEFTSGLHMKLNEGETELQFLDRFYERVLKSI